MSIEDQLREIRTRISQVQGRKARAQVEHENATERLTSAKASLKADFGVETNAEAKEKRATLEAELEAVVADVQKELAEAGA